MSKAEMTVGYTRIVEKREKAVLIAFGEGNPVWFPLYKISLNEADYAVTGPAEFMNEKLDETRGSVIKQNLQDNERVSLPPPAWENDNAIGIDVIVSNLSGGKKTKKRLFFPKSKVKDGTAPRWMVKKKQKEAIKEVAKEKRCREDDLKIKFFTDQGLLTA